MDKHKRRLTIIVITAGVAALLVLSAVMVLDVWLPRRIAAVINDVFGDYVQIGAVSYSFPLGVRVDDVLIKKRPGSLLGAEARRVKGELRLTALLTFRWDGRLLKKITAEDFTVYVYPIQLPGTTVGVAGAPPAGVGLTQPVGPAITLPPSLTNDIGKTDNRGFKPSVKPSRGRSNKKSKYDMTFEATGGRVVLKRAEDETTVLREVAVTGRLSSTIITMSGSAKAGKTGVFTVDLEYLPGERRGTASYSVAAAPAVHVVTFLGKPTFIKEISGEVSFSGRLKWGEGGVDHLATGRLAKGRLVLAAREVTFMMEDVRLTFTFHNADLFINEGSCAAALVRWTFGGRAGKLGLDITFKSENMTLNNLLGMVSADIALTYGGQGVAEFHIGGTLADPEFYLRVARTDIIKR